MLEQLSLSIPDKVWINNFRNTGTKISVTGIAIGEELIADFMDNIEQSKYFANVKLSQVSQGGLRAGFVQHSFELSFDVIAPKEDK